VKLSQSIDFFSFLFHRSLIDKLDNSNYRLTRRAPIIATSDQEIPSFPVVLAMIIANRITETILSDLSFFLSF